jgi:hypothetical protein
MIEIKNFGCQMDLGVIVWGMSNLYFELFILSIRVLSDVSQWNRNKFGYTEFHHGWKYCGRDK